MEIKRGDVYYVDLSNDTIGSVQGGCRPVVIISNNTGNHYSPVVIGCPITSKHKDLYKTNPIPTHCKIQLLKPSLVLTEQIFTIDKSQLGEFIRSLTNEEMNNIDKCLKVSVGL